MTHPTISLLLCVFVAAGKYSPSRCLAPKGEFHLNESLLCNGRRDTHTHTDTDCWEGFTKYAVEMGSVAMQLAKFHKDWFRHSIGDGGGGDTQTKTRRRSHKPTLGK
jgi:hypothetical protein